MLNMKIPDTKHLGKQGYTMKSLNLKIIGVEEEESKFKSPENISTKL